MKRGVNFLQGWTNVIGDTDTWDWLGPIASQHGLGGRWRYPMTPDPETGKEGYLKLWVELDTNTLVSKFMNNYLRTIGPGDYFLRYTSFPHQFANYEF